MKNDSRHYKISLAFISTAMFALLGAAVMGCIAALQFIYPGFAAGLGFVKSRPLHVSLAVAWIFLSAVGGIYYYLPRSGNLKWYSLRWPVWQLILILLTGTGIIICYAAGIFGGREYWEHPVWFSIPIVVSWLLLVVNFFKTIFKSTEPWPVYTWMWATGILFFLLTFLESNLWIFPYFRNHLVRDITVQWKSYGALVGSWNMLVYGTAAFLAEKLSGNKEISASRTAFLLYFLGFANLLFGWAHHTYTVPSASWVRNVSYVISMSEMIILAKLIWNIRKSVRQSASTLHLLSARFLFAADMWVFLNLIVALLISIPAINLYTHGTHVTVAHAMGSAIGINSMILLSSCVFIAGDKEKFSSKHTKLITIGLWITTVSLLVFWISLLWAGIEKGYKMVQHGILFQDAMSGIQIQLKFFAFSGLGILVGFCCILLPLLQTTTSLLRKSSTKACVRS